jgi:dienelactone hydrolase
MLKLSYILLIGLLSSRLTHAEEITYQAPEHLKDDFGTLKSPLIFNSGEPVRSASDWKLRRDEIKNNWHSTMGPWPTPVADLQFKVLSTQIRESFIQKHIQFQWIPGESTEGYLLVPQSEGEKPAVVVVYYEPETSIGLGKPYRDFGRQLTRRGFVTLSIGTKKATEQKIYSIYYPNLENAKVQPLSMLAYAASNAWQLLADLPDVDPNRIGITGHSFGGKWAMFASCLFDKYACAVWSDPGIIFDESRPNVNYWTAWYLGYEPGAQRSWDTPSKNHPRTGAYRTLFESGHNLHELHALMAPRPFMVSGGSEDTLQRWKALNHSIEVNSLLGFHNKVAMTNRKHHAPTTESNEQIYKFFESHLKKLKN